MRIFGFEINRANAPEQKIIDGAVEKDLGSFTNPNAALLFGQGYYPSNTGEPVTPLTSLQHDAVYACVRALAGDIAILPLLQMERLKPRGVRIVPESPIVDLLETPNRWQTPFDFVNYLVGCQVLRGNAYCWIRRDEGGRPVELIPLHPDQVIVQWDLNQPGRLRYRFTSSLFMNEPFTVPDEDMLHIRNCLSVDDAGALGMSPIAAGQNVIALGLAVKKSAAVLFRQGTQLRGVLTAPEDFKATPETIERMAASWSGAYAGNEQAHKVAFLEGGVSFQPISMTAGDAQMIEARKASVEDICRLFGVPLHRVQNLDRATNNNIETLSQDYLQNSLLPIARAFEQELAKKLLFAAERKKYYFRFDSSEITRADTATRGLYYTRALMYGWMTINEVRQECGLIPIEGGDVARIPSNTENATGDDPSGGGEISPAPDLTPDVTNAKRKRATKPKPSADET